MGVVLTCHRDVLDKQPGHRFVLAFTTFDESQSWFQEENKKSLALQSQTQIYGEKAKYCFTSCLPTRQVDIEYDFEVELNFC